jgi:DNA-binding ferritin-like protein (Dps family)
MAKWRDEKQRYKRYKARKAELPASYQAAVDAVERYAIRFGPGTGETLVPTLEDLIHLFEKGAADGTPVRTIVGDDPVQFVADFLRNYPVNVWVNTEREHLSGAIDRAPATGRVGS